jgi:hypothetical protein
MTPFLSNFIYIKLISYLLLSFFGLEGGRKSLSPDGSTMKEPKLQGSSEGLNITSKKMVYFRSLREGEPSPPPPTRGKSAHQNP